MPKMKNKVITFGSVFDDMGFSKSESSVLKIKSELYRAILKIIRNENLTQRELQKILDQPQSRISELVNGKISKISIEKILEYLGRLGARATLNVKFKKAA